MDAFSPVPLSDAAHRTLSELVYRHSRIRVGTEKQPMLANRLRRRLTELGLASFDDYCDLLRSNRDPEEIEHLVDFVSTNHTFFFREGDHFEFLRDRVLPEFARKLPQRGLPLRLWSAACSTGEEPYSMAIIVSEHLRQHPGLQWELEASDISRRALHRAEAAIYSSEASAQIPADLLKRYFQQGIDSQAGRIRVKRDLRQKVRFHRINLFQPDYPVSREQHVIFCRNVMIYFDADSRVEVVRHLSRHLAPGGYLFVGHSESLLGIPHDLESIRHGIYRRP